MWTWTNGKEEDVAHHADHIQVLNPLVLEHSGGGHDEAEGEHAGEAEQVQEAAALELHEREGDERGADEDEADEGRGVLGVGDARVPQDRLRVVEDGVDAAQLLREVEHYRHRGREQQAFSQYKKSRRIKWRIFSFFFLFNPYYKIGHHS